MTHAETVYLMTATLSDKVDARKLAQLLRAGLLSPVYHGEHGVRDLKELVRELRSTSSKTRRA